jgi:phosphatidylserine/phosphatidylglycerophosphate/cardiolipin synthase-like enzyme
MSRDLAVRVYPRIPSKASSKGSIYGSNQEVYLEIEKELKDRIQEIEEVHLALYLFNNQHLYQVLRDLAKTAHVIVTSTPLSAYDERKIGNAKIIYEDLAKRYESTEASHNPELLIYPHMYIWHGAEYAKAKASYSFHIKAGYVLYKDSSCKLILTSCNMAPGDPYHSELAIVLEDPSCSSAYSEAFKKFFQILEDLAVPWKEYHAFTKDLRDALQTVFAFTFIGKQGLQDWCDNTTNQAFFTGPFLTICGEGSTRYARKKIIEVIQKAERRIYVSAQHVHDLSPFNGYKDATLIEALTEKKLGNKDIEVKLLKQVSSKGLADKRRAAFVECHLSYAGVAQKVNKLVHEKFVVADDTVIISTGNFTATQFAWGDRQMELKVKEDLQNVKTTVDSALKLYKHDANLVKVIPVQHRKGMAARTSSVKKNDIFAEVNGFIVIEDSELASILVRHFDNLWKHKLSKDVKIPR